MASVTAILTIYEGAYINIRVSIFSMNEKLNRLMIAINKLVEEEKQKRERKRASCTDNVDAQCFSNMKKGEKKGMQPRKG